MAIVICYLHILVELSPVAAKAEPVTRILNDGVAIIKRVKRDICSRQGY